jgi:hypothetical protein
VARLRIFERVARGLADRGRQPRLERRRVVEGHRRDGTPPARRAQGPSIAPIEPRGLATAGPLL